MDAPLSMNTLRIVLVGLTALGAVVAAVLSLWTVAAVLTVACVAHGALWVFLARQRAAEHEALHAGVEGLLREEV